MYCHKCVCSHFSTEKKYTKSTGTHAPGRDATTCDLNCKARYTLMDWKVSELNNGITLLDMINGQNVQHLVCLDYLFLCDN